MRHGVWRFRIPLNLVPYNGTTVNRPERIVECQAAIIDCPAYQPRETVRRGTLACSLKGVEHE